MDLKLSMLAIMMIVLPSFLALLVLKYVSNEYRHRVNPLTRNLRRPAGTTLDKTLGGLQMDVGFCVLFLLHILEVYS